MAIRSARKLRVNEALAENSMDPNNLKIIDVLKVIAPLLVLVLGIGFLATGNKVFGLVLFVPVVLFFIYGFIKLPWQEIGRTEYEKEENQKQTLQGRVWVKIKHMLVGCAVNSVTLF